MAAKPGFEVVTDNAHRIRHFVPDGHPAAMIMPEEMSAYLNGADRLVHDGQEYDITPEGSLVHPDVEVPETAIIGAGVLLEKGVEFAPGRQRGGQEVVVRARAKIRDSKLYPRVDIGSAAIVLGSTLGEGTELGDFAVTRNGVVTGNNVLIGGSVKVDQESRLDREVDVDFAAHLGFRTILHSGVVIGEGCRIGKSKGHLLREFEFNEDTTGVVIAAGIEIPPETTVLESVAREEIRV